MQSLAERLQDIVRVDKYPSNKAWAVYVGGVYQFTSYGKRAADNRASRLRQALAPLLPRWVDDPEKEPPEEGTKCYADYDDGTYSLEPVIFKRGNWWSIDGEALMQAPPRILLGVPMP